MSVSLAEKVEALLSPIAEREGFEIVAVETAGGHKQPVVRVYVDREEGIDLDAICAANAWISSAIEAEEALLSKAYTLEVSSPGIDRPLAKLADFQRFAGETVKIKTVPGEGRTTYTGTLVGLEGDTVVLNTDAGETVRVPHAAISKAHIKGAVDFKQKGAGQS